MQLRRKRNAAPPSENISKIQSERLSIYLTDDEKQLVEAAAKTTHQSVADFTRRTLMARAQEVMGQAAKADAQGGPSRE
jgi:uncharacterized protein (DUF1778 family)